MTTVPHDDRYDITVRSGGLRRRRITEKVFAGLAVGSAVVAVGILALVLGNVIHRGISELSLDFFTKPRPLFGQAGGIADALVGQRDHRRDGDGDGDPVAASSSRSSCPSTPRPSVSVSLRVVLDVLNGVPAIIVGIFVFGLLVVGRGQSAIFGAFALAILMLPMVARATQEVLEIVPRSLREASLALGVTRWRTTLSIILPTAIGGHPHRRCHRGRPGRRRNRAAALHLLDRGKPGLGRRLQCAADAARRRSSCSRSRPTPASRRPAGRRRSC